METRESLNVGSLRHFWLGDRPCSLLIAPDDRAESSDSGFSDFPLISFHQFKAAYRFTTLRVVAHPCGWTRYAFRNCMTKNLTVYSDRRFQF